MNKFTQKSSLMALVFTGLILGFSIQYFQAQATPPTPEAIAAATATIIKDQTGMNPQEAAELNTTLTNAPYTCEADFVQTLDIIAATFYEELRVVVTTPTYDSQLSENFLQAYQKAKYSMELFTKQVNQNVLELAKASNKTLAEIKNLDCDNLLEAYITRIDAVYKSTLTRSMQAKKGAVILEKYDKINKKFEQLLSQAATSRHQLSKINDKLICYTKECIN